MYELNMTLEKGVTEVQSGCHANKIFIATRYVADAYCQRETPYQI